ncbi:MAG TPA: NAD(P)/FAD-dependent oxidoreductase [Euryarchaeota archaeon]|nr:NAD(P)/FAD-dependent oxidoreductase [Euryarchaeota archaeon]
MMKVVIIGNNVAGTTTAKSIRDLRPDIDINVFADERYHYYPRPMLIELIAGKIDEKSLFFYSDDWYIKNRIKVHLNTPVEAIEPEERRVSAGGKWFEYDALVIATGARAFIPPMKGLPKKNVLPLRTLDDAKAIIAAVPKANAAVIIGGGLLGLETARAIKTAKPEIAITVLERGDFLLKRQLDDEGGGILRALIEEIGVDVITEAEVEEIVGGEAVEKIRLKDGKEIDAQLVIVSAGIRANTELAEKANLKINRGVVVDDRLCCDVSNRIFAVGDVAEHDGRTWGIIPAALEQAKIVARKIIGQEGPDYGGTVPSNTLKVMGIDMTSIGTINPPEGQGFEEIRAKSEDGRVYKKYVLKDGKLVGAILLGSRKEIGKVTKLIKEGADISGLKSALRRVEFDFSGL